ncbi:MAG: hypothetical protein H0W66_10815, partial [Chthoniobacterales bacterium]|nr:hypothetical protein [Chthoniobacterales bacterium]
FLLVGKLDEGVARAAFLKAPGALEVVELAINLHPGELAERDRLRAGRFVDRAFDAPGGSLDVVEGGQERMMDDG